MGNVVNLVDFIINNNEEHEGFFYLRVLCGEIR